MSYYELWAIMNGWKREFSASEFAWTFAGPNPRKVLHDMVEKGLLQRLERGRYRVRSVSDYSRARNDVEAGYWLLSEASMPYALTGVDGVFVWSRGGYNAGRFFGFYPIHLEVLLSDLVRWKGFFWKRGKRAVTAGSKPRETTFGVFYILYPRSRVDAETVNGLRVVSLKQTLEFCRENSYSFAPAIKMLARKERQMASASG